MILSTILSLVFGLQTAQASEHVCASLVKEKATKLYALHYELDLETAATHMSDEVVERPSIKSPNKKMKYAVLETEAFPGKMGQYRIRMIFAVLGKTNTKDDCLLMGQEILDLSNL